MRSLALTLFLITTVTARRGATTPVQPGESSCLRPNGFGGMHWSYGWGLDDIDEAPLPEIDENEMKAVKRVPTTKTKDPGMTGWFGIDKEKHPYWEQVEDVMQSFE